ncbi:MAG TPA: hypothetical protein VKE92_12315 [Anaerolineales bacterium]|nr:hypothetical protein [Anaerolineales bacterium]
MTSSRQRALIASLIFTGIVIVGFFGLRTFSAFRKFREHRPPPLPPAADQQIETDVDLIRDWMTIPYISRTFNMPQKLLFDALGISSRGNEEKSLAQLNEEYSPQAPGIVLEVVKAAIRANQPPLPPEQISTIIPPATPIHPQP